MSFVSSCFSPHFDLSSLLTANRIDKTTEKHHLSTCCTLRTNDSGKSWRTQLGPPMISPCRYRVSAVRLLFQIYLLYTICADRVVQRQGFKLPVIHVRYASARERARHNPWVRRLYCWYHTSISSSVSPTVSGSTFTCVSNHSCQPAPCVTVLVNLCVVIVIKHVVNVPIQHVHYLPISPTLKSSQSTSTYLLNTW